ncbi:MAG: transposase [Candidatus Omnitrophica bacterium]|nr:transposase [Candidatus Omnitrophota bacterium]
MATPRIVLPDYPHHVIQRGNRNQRVFFTDQDRKAYLRFLEEAVAKYRLECWAYCLMDNHVHLVLVPRTQDSLARCIGEVHYRYSLMVNTRNGWAGHLWQGRFLSYPMEERHLYAAVRYVELNPVRAGLAALAEDYQWSSARAHVHQVHDRLLTESFLNQELRNWRNYLYDQEDVSMTEQIEDHMKNGSPMGSGEFVSAASRHTGVSGRHPSVSAS